MLPLQVMKIKSLNTFFKTPKQRARSVAEHAEESQVTVNSSSQEAQTQPAATQLEVVEDTPSYPERGQRGEEQADSSKPDVDEETCDPSPGKRAAVEAALGALEQEAVWQSTLTLLADEVWLSPRRE